jgi:hypothetical protein
MNTNLYQNFSFVLRLPERDKTVFSYEICPSGCETLLILFLYLFLFCSHIAELLFFPSTSLMVHATVLKLVPLGRRTAQVSLRSEFAPVTLWLNVLAWVTSDWTVESLLD